MSVSLSLLARLRQVERSNEAEASDSCTSSGQSIERQSSGLIETKLLARSLLPIDWPAAWLMSIVSTEQTY